METITKYLQALQCPFANNIDISSRNNYILLVNWLEDRKIRELEIEDREELRKDHENWNNCFNNYLKLLNCPYLYNCNSYSEGNSYSNCVGDSFSNSKSDGNSDNGILCMNWLLSFAISIEYETEVVDTMETEHATADVISTKINQLAELVGVTVSDNDACTGL